MIPEEVVQSEIEISSSDLPLVAVEKAKRAGIVGWDIETSGLEWKKGKIGTCQIFVPNYKVYLVKLTGMNAPGGNIESLLNDNSICKVFHHAIFDLRFMSYHWSVEVQNVACTKIASKILNPSVEDHSLKYVLEQHLNINLEKRLGNSNWLRDRLSQEQVSYAVQDVLYLPDLFHKLRFLLQKCGRWDLARASFDFLPTRAELDILGVDDVFRY